MRILCIPLDDRPCNYEQVERLGRVVSGCSIELPPKEIVATHIPAFNQSALAEWLSSRAEGADAIVIAADMWLYGGLVRSRKVEVDLEECQKRIRTLAEILGRRAPRARIYISSVLLRLTVTVTADQSTDVWQNVFRYSVLADEREARPSPELDAEFARVQAAIPPTLLAEFMAARVRNHRVNLELLKLLPTLSALTYGQEDCAEYGLHRREKRVLEGAITSAGETLGPEGSGRVQMMTGADELNSMLVMRAVADHLGTPTGSRVYSIHCSSLADLEHISSYEDITARRNLELHFEQAPVRLARAGEGGDARLAIYPIQTSATANDPKSAGGAKQIELCFQTREPKDPLAAAFAATLREGDALLDLSMANGANPSLMDATLARLPWKSLESFSSWNTTGNRLGTLVAHLGIRESARRSGRLDATADKEYLRERLLDDFVFQSRVRIALTAETEVRGHNPWALGAEWSYYSHECARRMREEAARLGLGEDPKSSLPWPRLFEVLNKR